MLALSRTPRTHCLPDFYLILGKITTVEVGSKIFLVFFREKAALNWFEVTQGPEQHSPSRVWSPQRTK